MHAKRHANPRAWTICELVLFRNILCSQRSGKTTQLLPILLVVSIKPIAPPSPEQARKTGLQADLCHVCLANVPDHPSEHTFWLNCGTILSGEVCDCSDGNGGKAVLGFDRITFDPDVMGGRACIRGMRITVSLIVNLVANGMSTEEILADYPYLEPDDIRQALAYAAWLADESVHALELTVV